MTWTDAQHAEALRKVRDGETLSNHELRKLREAGTQAGSRGGEAGRAVDKYERDHR